MELDPVFLTLLADWCVNLSAGWFAAAIIVPVSGNRPRETNERFIVENTLNAVAFFASAYILRII